MRVSPALCGLLFASMLAGCATEGGEDAPATPADRPLAVEVLDAEETVGRCNNLFRDQDVLVVEVRLTNLAKTDLLPSEYDVSGVDEDGEPYPMCWPDETVIEAGDSLETSFRFYVTSEECDRLSELVVQQRFAGEWVEQRVPTGIADPC